MYSIYTLIHFIKTNPNWQELIQKAPYHITVKEDPLHKNYFMLSYNMIKTQWGNEYFLTRACRGIVLHIEHPIVNVVSYAFDKFWNLGEPYAWKPDFMNDNLFIQEKVDGSLCKRSFYNGEELWYTNNGFVDNEIPDTIISRKDNIKTWRDLITKCLNGRSLTNIKNIEDYTLCFELVSPINRVVIEHKDYDLIFLGARHNKTYLWDIDENLLPGFKTPKKYSYNIYDKNNQITESSIRNFANSLENTEGFVLYKPGRSISKCSVERVKVKNIAYLQKHRLKDANGQITPEIIYESIRTKTIDDIMGAFQEYQEYCQKMIARINKFDVFLTNVLMEMTTEWLLNPDKKAYAELVMKRFKDFSTLCFFIPKYHPAKKMGEILDLYIEKLDYKQFDKLMSIIESGVYNYDRI